MVKKKIIKKNIKKIEKVITEKVITPKVEELKLLTIEQKQKSQDRINNIPRFKFSFPEIPWKKYTFILIGLCVLAFSLIYYIMLTGFDNKIMKYLGGASLLAFLVSAIIIKSVHSSIGFGFLQKILRVKKLKRDGAILLKIHTVSGRPKYEIVKGGKWMTYQFVENGTKISKRMFYDQLAIYSDYAADVPILEGTPDDIFPTNRFTGTRITTAPELVEKTIIDSSKSADELEKYKKYTKMGLYILGIAALALFLGFDLYRQSVQDNALQLAEMAKLCAQSATIIT